jgi:hypothetical protein
VEGKFLKSASESYILLTIKYYNVGLHITIFNFRSITKKMKQNISSGEAFRFRLKLGFIYFGGPTGQIAIRQKELVETKQWIEQNDFRHAINFCMPLPGPQAQQSATCIGRRLHGIRFELIRDGSLY